MRKPTKKPVVVDSLTAATEAIIANHKAAAITISVAVEFDDVSAALDAANDIRSAANSYGSVVSMKIINLPPEVDLPTY